MKKLVFSIYLLSFLLFFSAELSSQNVIIVVIDGARYSETFGSENKYIPRMWDIMKPKGTIYTNFYNDGVTKTNPGHAAILTGTWQDIPNDGSKRPTKPTIFEYFRKQLGIAQSENCVVAGADKLSAMSYSTHLLYGSSYAAMDITNDYTGDLATYENLISLMDDLHPRLVFVNFKEVDTKAHDGSWEEYLAALRQVDSLIHKLWEKIQADSFYSDKTTLLISNDHGRHDEEHGGFQSHGDDCDGCRHIMLLMIGNKIKEGRIINFKRDQRDIASTVAHLLNFSAPFSEGRDLLGDWELSDSEGESKVLVFYELSQNRPNPFNPATIIKYSIPQTVFVKIEIYDLLGEKIAQLVNEEKTPGDHEVSFSAEMSHLDLPSGVYFYVLQAGSFTETKKMVLLR